MTNQQQAAAENLYLMERFEMRLRFDEREAEAEQLFTERLALRADLLAELNAAETPELARAA